MIRLFVLVAGCLLAGLSPAQSTTIAYQGQLMHAGAPHNGTADLTFRLFDVDTGGTPLGPEIVENDRPVVDGLFQVELDFGAVFDGTARYLEVEVDGQVLSPRQAVNAAPMAVYALASAGDSPWQITGADLHYAGGRIGIGTSAPQGLLELAANSSPSEPQLRLVERDNDFSRIRFVNEPDPGRWWTVAAQIHDTFESSDRFNIVHSTQGDILTVSGSGTVGINDPWPPTNYGLSVNGGALIRRDSTIGSPQLYLIETQEDDFARLNFFTSGGNRLWAIAAKSGGSDPATGLINFFNNTEGDLFSIRGDGAVGVGITEPLAKLSVASEGQWSPAVGNGRGDFYIGNGTVGLSAGVALGGGGTGVTRLWTSGGVEHLFLGSAGHGTSLAILPGQVGIDNTNPGNTLDVDGGVRIRDLAHAGTSSPSVLVTADGDLVASSSVTRTYTLAPSAFGPQNENLAFTIGATARIDSGSGGLMAPVDLPHGAVITEIRVWYRNNSSNNMLFRFCRHDFSTGTCVVLRDYSVSGPDTDFRQDVITDFLGNPSILVDTTAGAYSMTVLSSAWDSTNTQVAGVQFVYTGP